MTFLILATLALIACHLFIRRRQPSARDAAIGELQALKRGEDPRPAADPISLIKAVGLLLYNKGALILIASMASQAYLRQNGLPFAEVLYLVNVVFSVFLIALVVRVLFFPEAAAFAEDSARFDAALSVGKYPFAMQQYRFATAISFAVPTLIAIAIF